MSLPTDYTFRDALDKIVSAIEAATQLTRGPQIVDPRANPSPVMATQFSIDIPRTSNRELTRGTTPIMLRHDLIVGFVKQIKMQDQYTSLLEALDTEAQIVAMPGVNTVYGPLRLEYVSTQRTLTPSREYLAVLVTLRIDHDFDRPT